MSDAQTLSCYAEMAEIYADLVTRPVADPDLLAFMAALPTLDAPVLDWGCGPGNSAVLMRDHGLTVEATDGSPEMAQLAAKSGIQARIELFDALAPTPTYRGIWSNFALLHAGADDVPRHIARAADALLPGGVLHLGMKEGTGSARDKLGRFYSFWTAKDLDHMTRSAGLEHLSTRLGEAAGLAGDVAPFIIHLSRKPLI